MSIQKEMLSAKQYRIAFLEAKKAHEDFISTVPLLAAFPWLIKFTIPARSEMIMGGRANSWDVKLDGLMQSIPDSLEIPGVCMVVCPEKELVPIRMMNTSKCPVVLKSGMLHQILR